MALSVIFVKKKRKSNVCIKSIGIKSQITALPLFTFSANRAAPDWLIADVIICRIACDLVGLDG